METSEEIAAATIRSIIVLVVVVVLAYASPNLVQSGCDVLDWVGEERKNNNGALIVKVPRVR